MPLAAIAAIGIGSAVAGGIAKYKGAMAAKKTISGGVESANNALNSAYDSAYSDLAPYRNLGYSAVNQLQEGIGPNGNLMKDFSMPDFQTDPGYQFRLSEGMKALERSASSRGNLFSGGTLKELDRYNQGFASNEYQNAFNRYNQNREMRYNMLAGIANAGQNAVNTGVNAGLNTAGNVSRNIMTGAFGVADARQSAYNALGDTVANAGGNISNFLLLNRPQQAFPNMSPTQISAAYGGPSYVPTYPS